MRTCKSKDTCECVHAHPRTSALFYTQSHKHVYGHENALIRTHIPAYIHMTNTRTYSAGAQCTWETYIALRHAVVP